MVVIENHCCDCAVPGYPCLGSDCELRRVEVHYCDCGCGFKATETGRDGGEYCEECLRELEGEDDA